MKTLILSIASIFAILVFVPGSVYAQAGDKLNPGGPLPAMDVLLKNANGPATTLLAAAKDNGLLVMFSCNTCPFVIKNQPITKKVMEYAAAHKVGVVVINSNEAQRDDADSYDKMVKYASAQKYSVPYIVDDNSKLADLFGASHTPEVYLFNSQKRLVYKGAMNDNPGDPTAYKKMYIEDAINAMIANRMPDPNTTKSIGCGIKRKA